MTLLGDFICGGQNSGNSMSSASSLSASAPPFTVDRLNRKLFPDPSLHFADSYYDSEPFSQGWQYPHPSAPMSELVMDSAGMARNTSLPHDLKFSGSVSVDPKGWSSVIPPTEVSGSAFGYDNSKKPSYTPSVPVFYEDHNVKFKGEGSMTSKLAYAPCSSGLERGLQRVDGLGFRDDNHAKITEPGRTFTSVRENGYGMKSYSDQLYEVHKPGENSWDYSAVPYHKYLHMESSAVPYPKFDDISNREVSLESYNLGNTDKKPYFGESQGSMPYNFFKTQIPDCNPTYHHYGAAEMAGKIGGFSMKNVTACYPDANDASSLCKSSSGQASAVRSSPGVIIRPPPAAANGKSGQHAILHKAAFKGNADDCPLVVDSYQQIMAKQQDIALKSTPVSRKGFHKICESKFSLEESGFISSGIEEISDRFSHAKDILGATLKPRVLSQLSNSNSSQGPAVSCDKLEAVKLSRDSLDHENFEVDSPCWKGATSSKKSNLDFEYPSCNLVKKALDDCFDHENGENRNVNCFQVNPRGITLEKSPQIDIIRKDCTAGIHDIEVREEKSLNEDKTAEIPKLPSSIVEFDGNSDMLIDQEDDFEVTTMESNVATEDEASGLGVNVISEGGSIAVHAANEVLLSPVSQEDSSERTKLPDPTLNVTTMLKALHNISDLLLVHLSNDSVSLENEDTEGINQIISKLSSCLGKKVIGVSKEPDQATSEEFFSLLSRELPDLNKTPGASGLTEESTGLQNKHNIQEARAECRNCNVSCKKNTKSPYSSSSKDIISAVSTDDDVAKDIKKVLEENFHFDKEMQTQASLFKSLWLEAEAKLCSLSYKANFNRMKILMEENKPEASPEDEGCAQDTPNVSSNPITPSEHQRQKDHVGQLDPELTEQAIMARFDILRSRNQVHETVSMEEELRTDNIVARHNILQSREANMLPNVKERELESENVDCGSDLQKYFGHGYQSEDETIILFQTTTLDNSKLQPGNEVDKRLDEFYLSMLDYPENEGMVAQGVDPAKQDSFSLDWEHVLHDDFPKRST